jgi:2-keto-4-pentenoate hydratase/2-oxohepta-3-ene-1,7-dioic acid hydratase in catechol pathway
MRLLRFDGGRVGVVRGERVHDVTEAAGVDPGLWPPVGMVQLVRDFAARRAAIEAAAAKAPGRPLEAVSIETPIPWPNKLVAFPANYHAHAAEMKIDYTAGTRGFFMKSASSLSGAGQPIVLPEPLGREVHHEGELAVVIGRGGRLISRADAMRHVFGYACLLDITVRGLDVERTMRKSYDSFTPVGPWITTADEVGDPSGLRLRLWVGEQLRQDANTKDLIVDVPDMIVMASSAMTLEPGDIIATGTPEGVGPIVAGDVVRVEIERVGEMSVRVVQGQGGSNAALPPAGAKAQGA